MVRIIAPENLVLSCSWRKYLRLEVALKLGWRLVNRTGVIKFWEPREMGAPSHRYFGDPVVKMGTLLQLL